MGNRPEKKSRPGRILHVQGRIAMIVSLYNSLFPTHVKLVYLFPYYDF